MLSTDNLAREQAELTDLLGIIEEAVARLAKDGRWRINLLGALDLLPEDMVERVEKLASMTDDVEGLHVNVAIGYGGRREIAAGGKAVVLPEGEGGADAVGIAEPGQGAQHCGAVASEQQS